MNTIKIHGNIKYPVINGYRICTECKVNKPVARFRKKKYSRFGIGAKCKDCISIRDRKREGKVSRQEYLQKVAQENSKKTHRVCYKCKKSKFLEEFSKSKNQPLGRVYRCKTCYSSYMKNKRNKKKYSKTNGAPFSKLCEISGCFEKYVAKGYCKRHLNRFNKHGDVFEYIPLNVKLTLAQRLGPEKFKEHLQNQRKNYRKRYEETYRKTPYGKISSNIRQRTRRMIKKYLDRGYSSRPRFSKNLGCTSTEFIQYLESRFDKGMSWDNYGSHWSIDHIIPIKYFIDNNIDICKSNFFKNLKPCWNKENFSKGATPPKQEVLQRILAEIP